MVEACCSAHPGRRWRGSVIGSDKEYKGAIYRIWNVANRKSYVGQSSKPWRMKLDDLKGKNAHISPVCVFL